MMNMIDRVTACLTPELGTALRRLARRRNESLSATVEVLLREHPALQAEVQALRTGKKGRDPEKLQALAETARRNWERAEARGQVVLRDR